MADVREQALAARKAARLLAVAGSEQKNQALEAIAAHLEGATEEILAANQADLAAAADLPLALQNRLRLNREKVTQLAAAVRQVAALPDPVGEELTRWSRPNGLLIRQVRVPLGVVGLIYEARPNVTVDAAVLCLKTGNAALLRGGKEAWQTNRVLTAVLQQGLQEAGLPAAAAQAVAPTREAAAELMGAVGLVDVLIPRGGAGLIRTVVEQARVPVIETGAGVCHTYVDGAADLDLAARVAANAKLSNPAVCNAMETLLVDRAAAARFLPLLPAALPGVELRGCPETRSYLPTAQPATEADWAEEYLGLTLAVKVVDGLEGALEHIARYGTRHSEAIITEDSGRARRFQAEADAAAVYVNASTRFTDGGEFGFGAEIGISTQKLHARGPMGLKELTSYKYLVDGSGQVR